MPTNTPEPNNLASAPMKTTSLQIEMRHAPWWLSGMAAQPYHVFYWITRGQGRIAINGTMRGFGSHSLIFLPSGYVHALNAGANMHGYAAYLHRDTPVPVPQGPAITKATTIVNQSIVAGYFEQLALENTASGIGHENAMESFLTLLSVWVERHQPDNLWATRAAERAADRLLARFLLNLERDFCKVHSTSDYAAGLGVTATHLTRLCKARFGCAASDLVQNRLMHEARHLLRDTDRSINAIAGALNYSSVGYFGRLFKAHTKRTPRAFRMEGRRFYRP